MTLQTHHQYPCPHTGLSVVSWFYSINFDLSEKLFCFNPRQICGSQNLGCMPQPPLLFSLQLQSLKRKSLFVLLRVIPQCHALKALMLASGMVHNKAALLLCLALTGYSRPEHMGFSLPVLKASLDSLPIRHLAQPLPTCHCRWQSYCDCTQRTAL